MKPGRRPTIEELEEREIQAKVFNASFSMARMLVRLVKEGYVRPEREAELTERAKYMEQGIGFLAAAELAADQRGGRSKAKDSNLEELLQ